MINSQFEVANPPQEELLNSLVIATDGGYRQDGLHSSAYIASDGAWGLRSVHFTDDPCKPACVPSAELRAIWYGLQERPIDTEVTVLTDSTIACNTLRKWRQGSRELPSWYDQNRKSPLAETSEAPSLRWLRDHVREAGSRLKVQHVKGHSGNVLNEAADRLCGIGINFLRQRYDRAQATKYCVELTGNYLLAYDHIERPQKSRVKA